ncbi:MAG: SMI1/KNR4 family protein [Bacillota bacterium]
MSWKAKIEQLEQEFGNDGYFGYYGPTEQNMVAEKIEERLGVKLPGDVKGFIREYGSLQLGNVCIDFIPNGIFPGCMEWTGEMRQKYPFVSRDLIAIMQDEGYCYLLECSSAKIYVWDPFSEPVKDDFYRTYDNLEKLIDAMAEWARQRKNTGL